MILVCRQMFIKSYENILDLTFITSNVDFMLSIVSFELIQESLRVGPCEMASLLTQYVFNSDAQRFSIVSFSNAFYHSSKLSHRIITTARLIISYNISSLSIILSRSFEENLSSLTYPRNIQSMVMLETIYSLCFDSTTFPISNFLSLIISIAF